ncbi:Phospholipase/carboxylesterase/thioesterase [Chytridium lagenaria]|nr:Phospholipase/carboxylesterase/thioesterase [Chytridium lagenaria]
MLTPSPSTPALNHRPVSSSAADKVKSVVVNATAGHTATVIFLHGLGDSGHGWLPVAQELSLGLPHVKFILPHAPQIPITLNGGFRMPGWYDIISLDKTARQEDRPGMLKTVEIIDALIQREIDAGVDSKRIVLGGFSQGSAMSLLTSLTTNHKLAGIVALSGYLPLATEAGEIAKPSNQWTPYFMGHGTSDNVVEYTWGKMSAERLKEIGRDVTFKSYRGMAHSACEDEVLHVAEFLKKVIP